MALLQVIKRHERLMLGGLAALVLALLSLDARAAKDVTESCEADADCDSGHCVTVKDGSKKIPQHATLYPPNPTTKANLKTLIHANSITKEEACAGADAAKAPAACK